MAPRENMIDRAIRLWKSYAYRYQNALTEYEEVKSELRKLKLPIRAIPVEMIREYPDIEFLRITEQNEVVAYLEEAEDWQIRRIIIMVEDLPFNYSYVTVDSYLTDARWRIRHHGDKKNNLYTTMPGRTRKVCRKGITSGYYQN